MGTFCILKNIPGVVLYTIKDVLLFKCARERMTDPEERGDNAQKIKFLQTVYGLCCLSNQVFFKLRLKKSLQFSSVYIYYSILVKLKLI